MENGRIETPILIDRANKTFNRIIKDITTEQGTYNSGILASYIGILFKLAFATIEKEVSLDAARSSFKYAVDFMIDVVIDGAYDAEKIK